MYYSLTSPTVKKKLVKYQPTYFGNTTLMYQRIKNGELTWFVGRNTIEYTSDLDLQTGKGVRSFDLQFDLRFSATPTHLTHPGKALSSVVVSTQERNRRSKRRSKRKWTRPLNGRVHMRCTLR
jgi:hypothetical protein